MRPPRRQRQTAVLAALLPILLVAGLWLGGHPEHLPGFLRNAFVANQQTRVVDEAITHISHDYYRPVTRQALSNSFGSAILLPETWSRAIESP